MAKSILLTPLSQIGIADSLAKFTIKLRKLDMLEWIVVSIGKFKLLSPLNPIASRVLHMDDESLSSVAYFSIREN